ncbi:hypothetical protein [Streptomyces sp. NPDC018833]|uniref:hypothetical protein n=1 Tax=Streptomyces sp. NPDC018833 TaxID=3365053 RepID=UPI0037AD1909
MNTGAGARWKRMKAWRTSASAALSTCDVQITGARRARCKVIAEQLGYSDDHIDDRLPMEPS